MTLMSANMLTAIPACPDDRLCRRYIGISLLKSFLLIVFYNVRPYIHNRRFIMKCYNYCNAG
jgi:hypothetical protein